MPRNPDRSVLDRELVDFIADIERLALALVEQALTAELARVRASLPSPAELASAAAALRRARG